MKVVILAGGKGQRLWPISRNNFPKQFLHFGENQSLLQKTVARFLAAEFCSELCILTSQNYKGLVERQLEPFLLEKKIRILCEPSPKNTGPAIAFAVAEIGKMARDQEELLIIPSDHYIDPEDDFFLAIESSRSFIKEGKIVTFGIKPLYPETGYGYIQLGRHIKPAFYEAASFTEKPSLDKANELLRQKGYLWNAGIYAFSIETFTKECCKHAPELLKEFSRMPATSIDYALMEKSTNIVVSTLDLHWSDLGSWKSIHSILQKDANRNAKIGNIRDIDTKNCLIMSSGKMIATLGIEDLVIIETDEVILVAAKSESEKIKQFIPKTSGSTS